MTSETESVEKAAEIRPIARFIKFSVSVVYL